MAAPIICKLRKKLIIIYETIIGLLYIVWEIIILAEKYVKFHYTNVKNISCVIILNTRTII